MTLEEANEILAAGEPCPYDPHDWDLYWEARSIVLSAVPVVTEKRLTYLDTLDLHAEMAIGRLNAAAKKKRLVETMKEILRDAYEAGRESAADAQEKSDG